MIKGEKNAGFVFEVLLAVIISFLGLSYRTRKHCPDLE